MAVPSRTLTYDTWYTQTWEDIKAQARDVIMTANPIWALLSSKGCLKQQVGGDYITRTIQYAEPTAQQVAAGDTLPEGDIEFKTVARWDFNRYIAGHVQRSITEDRANQGKYQITNYVTDKLDAMMKALKKKYETDITAPYSATADTTDKGIQGLFEILPKPAAAATFTDCIANTYGTIARPTAFAASNGTYVPSTGNTWWGGRYRPLTAPTAINLEADLRNLYNSIYLINNIPPDVIFISQSLYETYEDIGSDKVQIVRDSKMLNLGFDNLMYKGATMTPVTALSTGVTQSTEGIALMLTSSRLDIMYDPTLWMEMGDWKWATAKSMTRIAHILSCCNVVSDELRQMGMLY